MAPSKDTEYARYVGAAVRTLTGRMAALESKMAEMDLNKEKLESPPLCWTWEAAYRK